MLARTTLLLCLLAACAAQQEPLAPPAPLERQEIKLDPFGTISNCLPISVLVQPNATDERLFTLVVEAEPSVLAALSHNVTGDGQGGTLLLENTADFNTNRPIKLTVTMPASALRAINHQGTGAEVFVAPGFEVESFNATAAFGAGRLYVSNMVATSVGLQMSGTGDVVLSGSFGSVSVTSTGTGGIYVAGANESVALDLRGISNAYVQPAQPTTAITGTAAGINTVQFTDGQCTVQSNFPFLQICQSVPFVAIPAPNPLWTCGLAVRGSFTCGDQGTAYTSRNGFVGASGALNTVPVTTTTPAGVSAFTPNSFQFAGPSPAGPGTGTQQQSGSVTPGGTTASSNVAGTGSVGATSVAGPGGAQTSTTQGGQTTGFQTTGQQTTGGMTGPGLGGGAGGAGMQDTGASASATSSSTAFATSAPASSSASAVAGPGGSFQQSSQQGGEISSGVIRVGGDGASQATAASEECQGLAPELRMPVRGTE